ncbi:translation initiation factor IF-2-like [Panicum virgatum]|uniref:translation initiation factor IF-2-like n=1 Tax=Panicum virgatum TaxID=38727 RepID=UPI0019D5E5D2|nr:translation initiation factor IF-2-like [Panicum virgatum]
MVHPPGDDEAAAAAGASSPLVYQVDGVEAPATGEGVPAPTMSTGGDGSAASAEASAQMAPRPQPAPRVTPSDQASRGVGVPRARRSGTGKRSMSASSGAAAKDAAPLAPVKALKTGARATPHTAPQPLPVVDIVAEAAKLRAAMARGTQVVQQALAPGNEGDAGQSGAEATAPVDAAGDAGRGGADDAARPVVEEGSGGEVLDEGASGGAQHGAIVQSVVPPEVLRNEREEEAIWQAQYEAGSQIQNLVVRALEFHRMTDYQISQRQKDISRRKSAEMTWRHSQIGWLGQHNAELVLKNIEASTRMTDLGARQWALEEELARVTGECDVQRVTAEQKAREVEEQTAELQRLRTELEQKETELLQKEVAVVTLSGTLQEKGGRIAEHAKSAFRLSVLRALAVASTHYLMDLQRVSSGYVVPDDADADAALAIMDDADAAAEEFAAVLAEKLEADIPPIAEFDAVADPQRGGDNM